MDELLSPVQPFELVIKTQDGHEEGNDLWCVKYWLFSRASNSANTQRAYLREIKRWLVFLEMKHPAAALTQRMLQQARYNDAIEYIEWLKTFPEIPVELGQKYKLQHQGGRVRVQDTNHSVAILHGFYDEMQSAMVGTPPSPIMQVNPFKPFRRIKHQKAASQKAPDTPTKALSHEAWALLWDTACQSPVSCDDRTRKAAARDRLILAFLGGTWERRGAIGLLKWEHLKFDPHEGVWRIYTKRKGKPFDWYVIPNNLYEEIHLFRQTVGLPPEVSEEENARSIFWISDRQHPKSKSEGKFTPEASDSTLIYKSVKLLFKRASDRARDMNRTDIADEFNARGTGPHTIRHTMATLWMSSGGDARRAQQILGHSSLTITSKYDTRRGKELEQALASNWMQAASHPPQTHHVPT